MNLNNYISKKYLRTLKKELMYKVLETKNLEKKNQYLSQCNLIYNLLKVNEKEVEKDE